MNVKDHVANNQKVEFQFYRHGELWYLTEKGLLFPVPISDIGEATFNRTDKALLFMRYIRKQLDDIKQGEANE